MTKPQQRQAVQVIRHLGIAIHTLLGELDSAALHISELGCTCAHRDGPKTRSYHRTPCTGYDIAKEYWTLTNRIRRRAGVQEKLR